MKTAKNNKRIEYKVIFKFQDGREIHRENFDAKKDLTPQQNEKIINAFNNP